ncbi:MAG: adenylate/guanylate cyclase domain-containing protein [Deltaproteobacteria bacterium]|nr:adenylate/guanylate cyclase domain-containing protein [Deltaproteobacteria bacterium]
MNLLHKLPKREYWSDIVLWLVAGLMMAAVYLLYFKSPYLTGVKVLFGCLSFGILGGMLNSLDMEKRVIFFLSRLNEVIPPPRKFISVSRKMLFFVVTVLLFMVLIILLMVFVDIQFLMRNRVFYGPDIFIGVFKEILFAFAVLLVMSLLILGRFSRNLKSVLSLQIAALEDIGRGQYDTRVPVVGNDEFGLIAAKTNDMIRGLREKDICEISFGKYMSPEISEKILRGEMSPDGELSEVTILFCDLRGYTPFVEKRDPKDVVTFLNTYFSEMEKMIRQHNGIILQYIGDEIEAVFGAPVHEPDHADMAVKAAVTMRQRLHALNEQRKLTGENPVEHGIGIHTGEVLAGSVGSQERLTYAMVGDTVNIASRIQELNKQFSTDILISHNTKVSLINHFELAGLGPTPLKGKSGTLEIWKVL